MEKYEIKQLSEKSFEILGKHVQFVTKKGRTILTCSCQNHSRFCVENSFCFHKELAIEYIIKGPIIAKIDKLILVYENWIKNGLPPNPGIMLEDLKNLRKYWRFVNAYKPEKKEGPS